jgi:Carboxypeptidase regulatory-like domain/TonB dependent receptor
MEFIKMHLKPISGFLKSKTLFLFSLIVVTTVLLAGRSSAQEAGQISGTVTDVSGAVVPGAVLTAKNIATNAVRTATASSAGSYVFTNMEPATYELTSQVAGFALYRARIEVTVGGHITLDAKLSVTQTNQSIDVSAAGGAQINTQTQELSQVVDREQVSQLPSLTRNPYDFVALSGNVSSGDNSEGNKVQNTQSARGLGFSINGQRSSGTEILLDGVENISVFGDGVGINVPIDAVQEFSVVTSNFQPQYGRASGGVVNVATRSGSNAFHGNLWEFNRLAAYTSNTVTNAQSGIPKGQYTRNQFGFAVGGPIVKDKLFFFGTTEWTRVRSAAASVAAVPTPQFLALAAPNVQQFFATYGANQNFNVLGTTSNAMIAANNNGTPIANVPLSTPVFQTVGFNAPGDAGGGVPQNTYNIVGRVDYNLSQKTQLFFRYVDYSEIDQAGSLFASPYAAYNVGQSIKNQAYLLSAAHEFNPALSSVTKLSFSRFNSAQSFNTSLQNTPTLTLSGTSAFLPGSSSVSVQLPGFYDINPTLGGLPFGGPQNTVQINQDLNFVKGKHTAQFGAQILYIQDNEAFGATAQASDQLGNGVAQGLQNLQSGNLFEFSAAVNPQGALPCVANPYTGTLTQTPGCSINLPATSPNFARSDRFHDWAVYAQDAWKATPRTTINYGIRYEYYGVQHNNNPNLDSNFFYGAGTSLPAQIRSGQVLTSPNSPVGGLWKPQYGTVSPRIGFAYDVFGDGKTSVRGGYGISYERNFGNVTFNIIQNPPNYGVIVQNNVPLTSSNLGPLAGATGNVALPPTSLRQVDQNIRTAQTQFWSGAIERQLTSTTALSVQYTGSRGLHLYDIKNYNGLGSGNAFLGDPTTDPAGSGTQNLTRLNPQFTNINNRGSNGDSYYEGMNVQLDSRNLYHTGIRLVANYTFAHETDDLSTSFSETNTSFSLGYTDPFNPSLDHGSGDFDIRHRFVLAPIYKTPTFGASQHGLLNEALGGWQVTGIYTVRTGAPFSFYDLTDNASGTNVARYTPAGGVVPQHTFKSLPKGVRPQQANSYVLGTLQPAKPQPNPAFAVVDLINPALPDTPTNDKPGFPHFPDGITDWGPYPADMTARNSFRGPGAWNFDASVSKIFPIHEQINFEFRAEAFDLLNHHNLYIQEAQNDASSTLNIVGSKGGVGAGSPPGANDERRFGQFALKLNF